MSGMAFGITTEAMYKAWQADSSIFECHKNTHISTVRAEYGLTRAMLKNGYNIDTLLVRYGRVDWRDKATWKCNNYSDPLREASYLTAKGARIRPSPFEVVFYRPDGEISVNETTRVYMKLTVQRKQKEN